MAPLIKLIRGRCRQCGAETRGGMTCAERFYARLASAEHLTGEAKVARDESPPRDASSSRDRSSEHQDLILLAARYALAHPQTHSARCLELARAVVQLADAGLTRAS